MLHKWLPLIIVVVLMAGCATKGDSIGTAPGDATAASDVAAVGAGGMVKEVSLSARVITLREADNGFRVIALTEATELGFADGSEATLKDVMPGMTVKASGQPGTGDALLADRVLVLDTTPTPSSD